MTNHTDLIARLRKDDLFWEAPITCRSEAADALEAAQAEIERLDADRRVLQADGKHPAPCAKFCEATAFTIELRRAKAERDQALARLAELSEQEPVGYVHSCGDLTLSIIRGKGYYKEREMPLYAAPAAQPSQAGDAQDAARYRWLQSNAYVGIAPYPKPHEVWCTKLPNPAECSSLDAAIDAAINAKGAK